MQTRAFDAIIIGSGQAGTPLAFKLAGEGQKVAFIEKQHLGGTCLNVGCTPTKAYVASARRMWDAHHGEELGVHIPAGAKIDLKAVKARKDELIGKSVSGIGQGLAKEENITLFEGEARFSGHKTISVNGEELSAQQIFINVGGRPHVPPAYREVPHLTSSSILELEELPEHLIVIGGSYIGLEFGQMFRRFGSKVTVVERGERIIAREDPAISEAVQESLAADGVEFRLEAECLGARKNDRGGVEVQLNCSEGSTGIEGSHLLLAIGRKPNSDTLKLEATGLEADERGFITVNEKLETAVPGIFALGDVNGRGAFTHTAYNDFEIIADHLFGSGKRRLSDRITTYGLFVDPPLGRAGLTKAQAQAQGYQVKEAIRPMSRIARAKEKGETHGLMSILVNTKNDQILGAAILGVGGDEIISGILNLMYAKAPYTVLRDSVQVHPTVAELIPTALESL